MHQQTFGIVPAEAFQCPDVPKFLCDNVVRPQLNGQVENVWGLLHQTTSLSGPILRYIFVLAALTAMTAAVLLVPKIETLLKHARDQLASMDDDDDIDSLLEQFLRAVSSGGAATRRFSAHFDGDGDGVADAGSSVVDRAAFAGARGLGKVGSLAERTVLPLFAWLVNKTAHGATWLATCVACLLIFAASTLLLFAGEARPRRGGSDAAGARRQGPQRLQAKWAEGAPHEEEVVAVLTRRADTREQSTVVYRNSYLLRFSDFSTWISQTLLVLRSGTPAPATASYS